MRESAAQGFGPLYTQLALALQTAEDRVLANIHLLALLEDITPHIDGTPPSGVKVEVVDSRKPYAGEFGLIALQMRTSQMESGNHLLESKSWLIVLRP
jgi:hypothetical protein